MAKCLPPFVYLLRAVVYFPHIDNKYIIFILDRIDKTNMLSNVICVLVT